MIKQLEPKSTVRVKDIGIGIKGEEGEMTPKACAVAHLLDVGWDGDPNYYLSKVSFKPCNNLKQQALFPLLKTKEMG